VIQIDRARPVRVRVGQRELQFDLLCRSPRRQLTDLLRSQPQRRERIASFAARGARGTKHEHERDGEMDSIRGHRT
jgi:hypothetical protein